ncbi:MAG: hypothetical protein KGI49_03180 [Patescibacteria group bacterium]|nr:hypothetical protein [Patescibacteria group bacterium]
MNATVVFNAQGLRHIRYDGEGKPRSLADRMRRLDMLPLVPTILSSGKIHEIRLQPNAGSNGKPEEHFAVCGRAGPYGKRIKVIVRKTGSGRFIYASVM